MTTRGLGYLELVIQLGYQKQLMLIKHKNRKEIGGHNVKLFISVCSHFN